MSKFKETLNEILEDKEISYFKFAEMVGVPATTLYNQKLFNPSLNSALKIVDYLSSSLDYFEGKTDKIICSFNKDYIINFYENLEKELTRQNIYKKQLCRECGITYRTLKRWKNGTLPSYENLLKISNYLDVSMDELLGRKYVVKK